MSEPWNRELMRGDNLAMMALLVRKLRLHAKSYYFGQLQAVRRSGTLAPGGGTTRLFTLGSARGDAIDGLIFPDERVNHHWA